VTFWQGEVQFWHGKYFVLVKYCDVLSGQSGVG